MRTNYHTHTPRCKHASGTEAEYCERAIAHNYAVLGFTDHCPWPYENGFVSTYHMDVDELDGYVAAVKRVREDFAGRLEVHLGLECEYFPAYMNWLREKKEELGVEYLILGNHFDSTDDGGQYFGRCRDKAQLRRYVDMCVRGLETGLYSCFAHPDLFLRAYVGFDSDCRALSRELCQASKQLGIPMEYNLLGFINCRKKAEDELGYPCRAFWETAAEVGVDCIVGTDAHSPDRFDNDAAWDDAAALLDGLGLHRLTRLAL